MELQSSCVFFPAYFQQIFFHLGIKGRIAGLLNLTSMGPIVPVTLLRQLITHPRVSMRVALYKVEEWHATPFKSHP